MTDITVEQTIIEVVLGEDAVIEINPQPVITLEVNNNPIAVKGEDGIGFVSEEYVFSSPSSLWTVNHNKGYRPTILVLDIFNKVAIAEVEHVSLNQVKIYFSSEQVGKVVVN